MRTAVPPCRAPNGVLSRGNISTNENPVAQVVPDANTSYCRALCAPTGFHVAMGRRRRRSKQGPQEVHATMPAFPLASAVLLPASVALRQIEPSRTPNGLLSLRTSVFFLNY
jgi:hypothetical protein